MFKSLKTPNTGYPVKVSSVIVFPPWQSEEIFLSSNCSCAFLSISFSFAFVPAGLLVLLIHCHLLYSLSFTLITHHLIFVPNLECFWDFCWGRGIFFSCAPAAHFFVFLYRYFTFTWRDTDIPQLNNMIISFFQKTFYYCDGLWGFNIIIFTKLNDEQEKTVNVISSMFFSITPLFGLRQRVKFPWHLHNSCTWKLG